MSLSDLDQAAPIASSLKQGHLQMSTILKSSAGPEVTLQSQDNSVNGQGIQFDLGN